MSTSLALVLRGRMVLQSDQEDPWRPSLVLWLQLIPWLGWVRCRISLEKPPWPITWMLGTVDFRPFKWWLAANLGLGRAELARSRTKTLTTRPEAGDIVYFFRDQKYRGRQAKRVLALRRWHGPCLLVAYEGDNKLMKETTTSSFLTRDSWWSAQLSKSERRVRWNKSRLMRGRRRSKSASKPHSKTRSLQRNHHLENLLNNKPQVNIHLHNPWLALVLDNLHNILDLILYYSQLSGVKMADLDLYLLTPRCRLTGWTCPELVPESLWLLEQELDLRSPPQVWSGRFWFDFKKNLHIAECFQTWLLCRWVDPADENVSTGVFFGKSSRSWSWNQATCWNWCRWLSSSSTIGCSVWNNIHTAESRSRLKLFYMKPLKWAVSSWWNGPVEGLKSILYDKSKQWLPWPDWILKVVM